MAIAERELAAPLQTAAGNQPDDEAVPRPYFWTREQFHQLGEAGLFDGRRVILMEGEIIAMPPIGDLHRTIVTLVL